MSTKPLLYHSANTRSFRALWALEEVAIPYDLEMLEFPPRQADPGYLEVNPLGTVPYFVDGEVRMTESAAICHYIGATYGTTDLTPGPGDARFGSFLNYLHFGEATLTFPQTIVLRYGKFEPAERRSEQVVNDYGRWFLARARAVDSFLQNSDYAAGDQFTMADISVGYAIMLSQYTDLFDQLSIPVRNYWDRLQGRAGFLRAIEAQKA